MEFLRMGYLINCDKCKQDSWADNIVDLIDNHLDKQNLLKCSNCGASGAYICKLSETQEKGEWERWIKGVIRIDYKEKEIKNYHPYIFLLSHDGSKGKINSVQISYYKDLRKTKDGRLKHGHGPGGTPVLNLKDMKNIFQELFRLGLISKNK